MSDSLANARVIVTRAEPGAARTAARLVAIGVDVISAPVLTARPRPVAADVAEGAQAVLVTSPNGARRLGDLDLDRAIRVFAVGDATAQAASEVGFLDVSSSGGNVDDLAALASRALDPKAGPVLYLRAAQVAGDLSGALAQAGFETRDATAYEAEAVEQLPDAARRVLMDDAVDAVLFHSARGATVFTELVQAAELDGACGGLVAAAMSWQALKPAEPLPFLVRRAAERPTEQDLFIALAEALAART